MLLMVEIYVNLLLILCKTIKETKLFTIFILNSFKRKFWFGNQLKVKSGVRN